MSMVAVEEKNKENLWKKFEKEIQNMEDYPNGILNKPFCYWGREKKFPLDWIESNVDRIMDKFKSVVQKRSEVIYDAPVWVDSIYQYSYELYLTLFSEINATVANSVLTPFDRLGLFSDIYATISVKHDQLTKRNGQSADIIRVQRLTSLRKLSGDFKWRFAPEGSVRATDVRYTIRRQLKYLYEQKSVVAIFGGGGAFDHVKKGAAGGRRSMEWRLNSAEGIIQRNLPMAYPTRMVFRIKQERFLNEHPMFDKHVSTYRNDVYRMYKLGGDDFLAYANRANEETENTQNRLHDAIYPFSMHLDRFTKAAFKKCLTFSLNKNAKLMEAVSGVMGMQNLSLKEQRTLLKTIVFSDDPIKVALEMVSDLSEKQNTKLLRSLRVKSEQATAFVSRMQVYAAAANLQQMVNMFGTTGAGKMIRGEYPGLFRPETFMMTMKFVGEEIRRALGDRGVGATVSNPKRLFKHLSKFGYVRDMMDGRIEKPDRVLTELRHMGHKMPKEHEQALMIRAEVEPKCSPEFLIAGNASVCCMSFGADNAQSYARHQGFGILNFYLGDRIIANSVIWINKLKVGQVLVFDNIEVAPNYTRFNPYLQELYLQIADALMTEYECIVAVQGRSFSDLALPAIEHPMRKHPWKIDALDVNEAHFYTDANRVNVVATCQSEEEARLWELQVEEALVEEGLDVMTWVNEAQTALAPDVGYAQPIPLINPQTGHVNPAFLAGQANGNHIEIENWDIPF